MARKVYIDPARINFKVERELKESAEAILERANIDVTCFLTLMLRKLVDGKIRLSPFNATSAPTPNRAPVE
jgi:antitoxin component of RelBE/YafQ-DinJ toxin-antitoxin module